MTGHPWRRVAVRLGAFVPVLLIVLAITYALLRATPGGPLESARATSAAVRANLAARRGLTGPPAAGFLRYAAALAHGDLGESWSQNGAPVATLLAEGAGISVPLGLAALAWSVPAGIALGFGLALGTRRRLIAGLSAAASAGLAIPSYVVAPALALWLGLEAGWFPVGGWDGRAASLVLPVVALGWIPLWEVVRLTEAGVRRTLEAPFVEAARARGVGPGRVLASYVAGPALAPVAAHLGPLAGGVLAGSLVVERVYGLPGMGAYLVDGALARDYPLVLGATLAFLAILFASNLASEALVLALGQGRPAMAAPPAAGRGRARRAWLAWVALSVLGTWLLAGGVFTHWSPATIDWAALDGLAGGGHWLGLDALGRDAYARLLEGSRTSLALAAGAALVATLIGGSVGALAGLGGRLTDTVLMRAVEVGYALPQVLVILLLAAVLGRGPGALFAGLVASGWVDSARLVRGEARGLAAREFVLAARAMGIGRARLYARHVFPHLAAPLAWCYALALPRCVLAEGFVSFLGLGVQEPRASLGTLLGEAARSLETEPWRLAAPALVLATAVLAFTALAGAQRDAERA